MTVTSTVKAIGATVKSIAPMKAEIEINDGLTKDAVVKAIQNAGYTIMNETL